MSLGLAIFTIYLLCDLWVLLCVFCGRRAFLFGSNQLKNKKGTIKRLLFALTLTLLSGLSASTSSAQQFQSSSNADSPAVRRAKELAQVINSGKPAESRKYIQENYAPAFLNIPMERHLNFISGAYDQSRGIE